MANWSVKCSCGYEENGQGTKYPEHKCSSSAKLTKTVSKEKGEAMTEREKLADNQRLRNQIYDVFTMHKGKGANGVEWKDGVIKDLVRLAGFKEERLSPDDHILYTLGILSNHVSYMLKDNTKLTVGNLLVMKGYLNGITNLIRGRSNDGIPIDAGDGQPSGNDPSGQDDKNTGDGKDTGGHEEVHEPPKDK